MKVATLPGLGGSDALVMADAPMPSVGPNDVLIRVFAAGVNRADVLQRKGKYPSPPDAPLWPGLEVAGVVEALGNDVRGFAAGDRVCALVPGGGYAEFVSCDAALVLPTPAELTDIEAGALPEAVCTVLSNFRVGGVPGVESVLVHGGSGGIGTTAIQVAKAMGLRIIVTAGGAERVARCLELGADAAVDYRSADFGDAVAELGGVDMVLDCVGGDYLTRNLDALRPDGTLVIIGLQSGSVAELNLATVVSRRLTIAGTSLRSRPLEHRAAIIADVRENLWPLVPSKVRPLIHAVLPLADVGEAHRMLEAGEVFGKVVLSVA